MAPHHSTMFYDPKTILLANTNSDNISIKKENDKIKTQSFIKFYYMQ